MTVRVRLLVLVLGALLGGFVATFVAAPAFAATRVPSYAAASADLSVRIYNKVDAKAGQRVAYTIVVMNNGPSAAGNVNVRLQTSVRLKSINWKAGGNCSHNGKVILCYVGRIANGSSATTTISGIMPTGMKVGTNVRNLVTVTSSTRLVNTGNDQANDNYQLGVPRGSAVTASPRPHAQTRLDQAANTTGKVFNFSRSLVDITLAVLAAGVLWFIVGLTVHRVSKARRGVRHR